MRIGTISSMVALLAAIGSAVAQPPGPATRPGTTTVATPPPLTTEIGDVGPGPDAAGILGVDPAMLYNRFYGRAEYLLWKIRNSQLPSFQLTVPYTSSGLDQLQTNVDVPGGDVDHAARSGGRFTLGYWFDLDHNLGAEVSFFQLENRQDPFFQNQIQNTPLNVTIQQNVQEVIPGPPVIVTQTQVPLDIVLPAVLTVTANGRVGPTDFFGGEISARSTRAYFGPAVFDLLGGFRYLNLNESLALDQNISMQVADPSTIVTQGLVPTNPVTGQLILPPIPTPITNLRTLFTTVTTNQILAQNRFYGANLGASFECYCSPRITFSGFGKVAVGAMTQEATMVNYTTTVSGAAGVVTTPGGVFSPAVATLAHSRTRYAFVPEFNLNLGFQLTQHCKATLGYNFLYLTTVVRPADQIIYGDSGNQITIAGTGNSVNVNQPTFRYQDADFYAQGLVGGLEFRY